MNFWQIGNALKILAIFIIENIFSIYSEYLKEYFVYF